MALTLSELQQRIADPTKTMMIGPTGGATFIESKDLKEAFKKGYKEASQDEIQSELDFKEFGDSFFKSVGAGVAGTARGLTFGLSDPIFVAGAGIKGAVKGAFDPDITAADSAEQGILEAQRTLRGLEEQNPAVSMGGEIAGAVLPAILSGGTSAAGTAARATPAGASAVAGRFAENKVAQMLSNVPGVGEKLAKIGGMAAGATIEGGLYGTGDYISALTLEQEPEFSAEGLISYMGSGALMGGAAGGLMGSATQVVAPAVRNISRKLIDATSKARGSFVSGVSDSAKNLYSKVASFRTGVPEDDIRTLFDSVDSGNLSQKIGDQINKERAAIGKKLLTPEEIVNIPREELQGVLGLPNIKDIDSILSSSTKLTNDQKDKIYRRLYEHYKDIFGDGTTESIRDLNQYYERAIKSGEIQHLIETGSGIGATTTQSALDSAKTVYNKFDEILNEMNKSPDIFRGSGQKKDFAALTLGYKTRLAELARGSDNGPNGVTPHDIYKFITEERKNLDTLLKYDANIPTNQISTINKMKEARLFMKDLLVDKNVWGEPVGRVASLNLATSEYLTSLSSFKKMFGKKIVTSSGKIDYVVNPSSISAFLKNPDAANNALKKEVIENFMGASKGLTTIYKHSIEKITDLESSIGFTKMLDKVFDNLDSLSSKNEFLLNVLEKNRLFADVKKQAESSGLIEFLPVAGWASGMFGGMFMAPAALLLRAAKNPAGEILLLNKMRNALGKIPKVIDSTIDQMGKAKPLVKEIRPGAPAALLSNKDDMEKSYYQYSRLATSLQNDPELLNRNLLYGLGEVEAVSPLIAGVMREKSQKMIQFISSKVPKTYTPDSLNPNNTILPPRHELSKFYRYMRAVNDPLTVFTDMAEGNVSREGVEVLKELYPSIYSKFYEKSITAIAEGKIDRITKLKLKAALGINDVDINLMQSVYSSNDKKKEQGQGKPSKKKSGRQLSEAGVKRSIKAEEF